MGLMDSMTVVFKFFRDVFDCLPNLIQLLVVVAFGSVTFVCVLKGVGR